jgi:hypothetical protein
MNKSPALYVLLVVLFSLGCKSNEVLLEESLNEILYDQNQEETVYVTLESGALHHMKKVEVITRSFKPKIDESKILCRAKSALKFGRCLGKYIKEGKCHAITIVGKEKIALEVPCKVMESE